MPSEMADMIDTTIKTANQEIGQTQEILPANKYFKQKLRRRENWRRKMARLSRKLSRLDEIHNELKIITLRKENPQQSLGFTIVGGDDKRYGSGIFIKNVVENGLACKNGKLKRGDKILWVDEHNLENVSHKEAAWILQHTSEVVEIIVSQTNEKKSILDESGLSPLGCAQLIENRQTNEEPLVFEVRYLLEGQS